MYLPFLDRCQLSWGVLPKKLEGSVRPDTQNSYPIYDQDLLFSLPYLWHNQKFDSLFMTICGIYIIVLNIIYEGFWLIVSSIMMKQLLLLKKNS